MLELGLEESDRPDCPDGSRKRHLSCSDGTSDRPLRVVPRYLARSFPMKRLFVIAGLAALGGLLPVGAMSQSSVEFRYPDGLVVSPLPVVPSIGPTGDI